MSLMRINAFAFVATLAAFLLGCSNGGGSLGNGHGGSLGSGAAGTGAGGASGHAAAGTGGGGASGHGAGGTGAGGASGSAGAGTGSGGASGDGAAGSGDGGVYTIPVWDGCGPTGKPLANACKQPPVFNNQFGPNCLTDWSSVATDKSYCGTFVDEKIGTCGDYLVVVFNNADFGYINYYAASSGQLIAIASYALLGDGDHYRCIAGGSDFDPTALPPCTVHPIDPCDGGVGADGAAGTDGSTG